MKVDQIGKKLFITVLLIVGGALLCEGLYLLIDVVMNGFLVEWFETNYVSQEWHVLDAKSGVGYYYRTIRWWKVKRLLLTTLIIIVTLWILGIRGISVLYASWREKRLVMAIGQKIGDFMRRSEEASAIFPKEYAPVSLQMAEIRATMQSHEQALKEEAARKNDLITYLAHDLKTPLTSVIGYLSLLEEAPDMPEEQKAKYVHITLEKALRLERLINEFFEITRYNLQQIVLEKETVDLAFMLMQMTDEFYPLLSAHGNTVKLEVEEEGTGTVICQDEAGSAASRPLAAGNEALMGEKDGIASITVYADVEKLARVFNNILKNAIAYSYPNTEIRVACHRVGDKVIILFQNRGKTIPSQKLDFLFEKFFRLDEARASNTGGAGLGLAIAKDIVNLHGGRITADSANEVMTFTVELPAFQAL